MTKNTPTITVYGLEELNGQIKKIEGDVLPGLVKATKEAQSYVHSQVPGYPAEPPGSTYRRTGTLGREINTPEPKRMGTQIVGSIGTADRKAPWVIGHTKLSDGRGPQAWMHKGRWWILRDVVMGAREQVVEIYRRAVREMRRGWK